MIQTTVPRCLWMTPYSKVLATPLLSLTKKSFRPEQKRFCVAFSDRPYNGFLSFFLVGDCTNAHQSKILGSLNNIKSLTITEIYKWFKNYIKSNISAQGSSINHVDIEGEGYSILRKPYLVKWSKIEGESKMTNVHMVYE